ncbi:MAG: hypothetical protein Kow0031_13420 [Anaerolineae bacterium]
MLTYSTSAETVYNVSRHLNSSLDLDEVLGNVLRLTVDATGATRGSLFLLDEEGRVTRQILARPDQSPEVSRQSINKVMQEGLAGWVYRHQYGALAADTSKDERWVRLPNDAEITGSALVVPLLYQERVNGLLALHHRQVRFFDESHLALAAGIAGQAAVALENARLFTQVKDERESLYALINAMPNPVLVVDKDNLVTFANQLARQSLRVPATDVPLKSLPDGAALKAALDTLAQRAENHVELRWSDNRVYNVSCNYVSQVGTVVVLDDITYLKELDAMKTQFVETVSHDLKNPLSVILGFVQLLELDPSLSPRSETSVKGIKQSAHHMNALISDLLDLARIEAGMGGEASPIDFARLVVDILPGFELQIERKQMAVTTNLPAEPVRVLGNKTRLSQIINNFVGNAIKYTPENGEISVNLTTSASEMRFFVTDNGPGISPAGQSQLFQKFYRVPEIQEKIGATGTGLGLSIVKAIAEAGGGRVWVKSEVGVGSTFGCTLPLVDAAPAAGA